ncbi:helix-turn-helix domain-containing protein [Marinomonas sp. THO17]|uniref:AraC family transcriptional regulator n=1 Tax=Marinomonas sp. THO17 TaxID=3149048 RepID=UPI00336C2592
MLDISSKIFLDYNPLQGKVADGRIFKTQQPSVAMTPWVQSYWQLTVPKGLFHYHSVPDNCVDWIINLDCFEDNFLIPPFLSSTVFHIDGPGSFFAIRFRVLGHKSLISVPLGEWGELGMIKAEDVLPREVLYSVFDTIHRAEHFDKRCRNLSALLLSVIKLPEIDPRLGNFIRFCYENIGSHLDLSDGQSSEFGVSARQLRRLAKQHVGLSPKDFYQVIRFQNTLKTMKAWPQNKAYLDHYYDQPHFAREFKRLSGVTPTQFRNMSVLYNHDSYE